MRPQTGRVKLVDVLGFINSGDDRHNKRIISNYSINLVFTIDHLIDDYGYASDSEILLLSNEWKYFEPYNEYKSSLEAPEASQKLEAIQLPPTGDKSYMIIPQELYDEILTKASKYDKMVGLLKE